MNIRNIGWIVVIVFVTSCAIMACSYPSGNAYIIAIRTNDKWTISGCDLYRNYDNEPNGKILVLDRSPGGVARQLVLFPEDFKALSNEKDVDTLFPDRNTFEFSEWDHVHDRWNDSKLNKKELLKLINGE